MPIKNYTTSVAEDKTVGEIMGLLAGKGARTIQVLYDEQGRPSGVSFMLILNEMPIPFRLPCNFDGVFKALLSGYKDRSARYRFERNPANREQSRRIAWRIVKDWVAAQMALIEAEQATIAQVFLPYCVMNGLNGSATTITMYDRFLEQVSQQRALTAGSEVA